MRASPKTAGVPPPSAASPELRPAPAEAPESGARIDWFPTSIWRFNVPDHEALNLSLMRLAEQERARDPVGMSRRSSMLGWHSTDQLHRRPEMERFVAVLQRNVEEVGRAYRMDTRQVRLELATCWIIVNGKFASGAVHCHPHSFLSGVYYVRAPDNCGDIFFQDPRPAAIMGSCPVTEHAPWTVRQISYRPLSGGMLIFPSWLYHGVEPNLSDESRVSVSFNLRLRWIS
jgi:uncharacterized protein (TIGR02466 family)